MQRHATKKGGDKTSRTNDLQQLLFKKNDLQQLRKPTMRKPQCGGVEIKCQCRFVKRISNEPDAI